MNIDQFSISRLPRIEFGIGKFSNTAKICTQFGNSILIVTGAHSFRNSAHCTQLENNLAQLDLSWRYYRVDGEPSPEQIDDAVLQFSDTNIDMVLGIGGGSALDAAKAIAGLLKVQRSVMDYLEGVGPEIVYEGPAVPFIAIPTTAGTGSEATKNSVLSRRGHNGFKKSFRDDKLVAEYAIVDPSLLSRCPANIIAANGMDALTQLLESLLSIKTNSLIDSLSISGLQAIRDGLLSLYDNNEDNPGAQTKMAYASMLSGICLAQTGLGSVHGLASPLGAFFPIPHGEACGTLVAEATKLNITAMLNRDPDNPGLGKYALAGELLTGVRHSSQDHALQALCELLFAWTEQLNLPRLSHYGVSTEIIPQVVKEARGSSMQTNPIVLTDTEIEGLLLARL